MDEAFYLFNKKGNKFHIYHVRFGDHKHFSMNPILIYNNNNDEIRELFKKETSYKISRIQN